MVKLFYPDGTYAEGTPEEIRDLRLLGAHTIREHTQSSVMGKSQQEKIEKSQRGRIKLNGKGRDWPEEKELRDIAEHANLGTTAENRKANAKLARKYGRYIGGIVRLRTRIEEEGLDNLIKHYSYSRNRLSKAASKYQPWTSKKPTGGSSYGTQNKALN